MISTPVKDVLTWSRFQEDRGINFNGFLLAKSGGNVLVDPMPLDARERECLQSLGGAVAVLLTNADHVRSSISAAREFGAPLYGPRADEARFGSVHGEIDVWFDDERDFPSTWGEEIVVREVRGGKSPVEIALYLPTRAALLFGDVVRTDAAGRLMLLPADKVADPHEVRASLQDLLELDFDTLLLGDGLAWFENCKDSLTSLATRL